MKKTKLLMLALAAFSSVAIAAVGCGDDTGDDNPPAHVHNYSWKSDDAGHWQECSECDNKTDSTAHVDVVIKETKAEGEDGYCDVCDRLLKKTVTFNLNGRGETAPAAQKVEYGKKAQEPAKLIAEEYKVTGWYTDAACSDDKKFNFDTAVTTDITLYAKWEEDTTPGSSAKYAYALTKDVQNFQSIGEGGKLYYKFTAEAEGRYTISLGIGDSAKCNFTTDKDEEVYGKDCDAAFKNLDLEEGETVVIVVSCKEELDAAAKVTALVNVVEDEALPQDRYATGVYVSADGSVRAEFVHDTKSLKSDLGETTVKYIGGKYDMLYFVADAQGRIATIKLGEDGKYMLQLPDFDAPVALSLQPQVALSAVSGHYEPAQDSGVTGGLAELYIYQSSTPNATSVRYRMLNQNGGSSYSNLIEATYNADLNKLTFDQYIVTLNVAANGTVESVNLSLGDSKGEYSRKADAPVIPPVKLPLEDGDEYIGTSNTIRSQYGSQYFGSGYDGITVMEYDQSTGKYSFVVSANGEFVRYSVVIDENVLKLYDASGTQIDTLSKFEWVLHDLPTVEQSVSVAVASFQKGYYIYVTKQAGWYNITVPEGVEVFYPLSEYDYTDRYSPRTAQDSVYLAQGDLVGVYMETPAAITVAVAPASTPSGLSENSPKALVNGSAVLDVAPADATDPENLVYQTSYFAYTAPESATYSVSVSYNGMGTCSEFYINNELKKAVWDGLSYAPISVIMTSEQSIVIKVVAQDGWQYIAVAVAEDITVDATTVTFEGEPDEDSLYVSATVATGAKYHIVSTKGEDVVLSGGAAFTVVLQDGTVVQAEQDEDNYTAVIYAGEDVYFKLKSDTQQNVTLSQTFEKGSEGYPIAITLTDGQVEIEVDAGDSAYFTLTPGVYTFNSDDNWLYVSLGEDSVNLGGPVQVEEGDVFMYAFYGRMGTATLTIKEVVYVFSEDQAGTYKGESSVEFYDDVFDYNLTLTFDRFGIATYTLVEGENDPEVYKNITITKNAAGKYTFTYGEDMDTHTVVFSFVEGALQVSDENVSDAESFTMNKQKIETIIYVGKVNDNNAKIVITGDKVSYFMDVGSGLESVVQNAKLVKGEEDGSYTFTYNPGYGAVTVKLTISGDTIAVDDDGWTGTLTKQADAPAVAEGTEDNPKVVEFTGGTATVTLPEEEEYYILLSAGNYSIANDGLIEEIVIVHSDASYDFVEFEATDSTISLTVSTGDTVSITHMFGGEITITAVTEEQA